MPASSPSGAKLFAVIGMRIGWPGVQPSVTRLSSLMANTDETVSRFSISTTEAVSMLHAEKSRKIDRRRYFIVFQRKNGMIAGAGSRKPPPDTGFSGHVQNSAWRPPWNDPPARVVDAQY